MLERQFAQWDLPFSALKPSLGRKAGGIATQEAAEEDAESSVMAQ